MKSSKKSKLWIIGFLVSSFLVLFLIANVVGYVDPFFHYHKPYLDEYYYVLDNERSQNYGIAKQFEYDAIITGTSMAADFKTTEFNELFGTNAIKTIFLGGEYKEINDYAEYALECNPNVKIVVRSLERYSITTNKDNVRTDLGKPTTYLWDDNVLTDVNYVFNHDVLFSRIFPMIQESNKENPKTGIDSFDDYSNQTRLATEFGVHALCPNGVWPTLDVKQRSLTEKEEEIIIANIKQNVTDIADAHPDITFYYYFPPYSITYFKDYIDNGKIFRQRDAEKVATREILKHPNIKLFHFGELYDVTTDLSNYYDKGHYAEWIASDLLKYMKEDKYLFTLENYEQKIDEEFEFYYNYDYPSLNQQGDEVK